MTYVLNMGITQISASNRLRLLLYLSSYLSGSLDNFCHIVVSRSLIFNVPQTFLFTKSLKQSLFY